MDQLIIACANCQLVNSYSYEAHHIIYTIDSDTPFDVVFIEFWGPWDIPDQDGYCKIITYLSCMTVFVLAVAVGLNYITADQVTR